MEAKMSNSWYYGFLNSQKENNKCKAKVHLEDQIHQQWVTYDNFADMYNCVCEQINAS